MESIGSRPLFLVVLSGGGFSFETKQLLSGLADRAEFYYLRTPFGGVPGTDAIPAGGSVLVPSFATKTKKSQLQSIRAFVQTIWATLRLLRSQHVHGIICVGCSHAVPVFMAGRIMRTPNIYLESITRVDRLSLTGRIVYHFGLSNVFIVQWPSLQKSYPTSRMGTIL